MVTGSITKRAVDALSPVLGPVFLWDKDVKGFGVKASLSGSKTFLFQYRMGGRGTATRRMTIGKCGSITPDQARKQAQSFAHDVAMGNDPAVARRTRNHERVTLAFSAYAQLFLDEFVSHYWRPFKPSAESILRLHVVPVLGRLALPEITASDVTKVLDRIPKERQALRRNTFTLLRRLLNWAQRRGDLRSTPLENFEAPPAVPSRDRVLDEAELRLVWHAAAGLGPPFGALFQMLIATGQRREEVAGLDWTELDRENLLWTLPASRSKNNIAHLIPLNALALIVLDKHCGRGDKNWPPSGLVFTTTGKSPVSGHSKAKARLDSAIVKTLEGRQTSGELQLPKMVHWRLHDLRRTVATGLQRLDVRFEVTEAVLNHVSGARGGVAGVYQRHGWFEEKRAALDAWSTHLQTSLYQPTLSNVFQIKSVRL